MRIGWQKVWRQVEWLTDKSGMGTCRNADRLAECMEAGGVADRQVVCMAIGNTNRKEGAWSVGQTIRKAVMQAKKPIKRL